MNSLWLFNMWHYLRRLSRDVNSNESRSAIDLNSKTTPNNPDRETSSCSLIEYAGSRQWYIIGSRVCSLDSTLSQALDFNRKSLKEPCMRASLPTNGQRWNQSTNKIIVRYNTNSVSLVLQLCHVIDVLCRKGKSDRSSRGSKTLK